MTRPLNLSILLFLIFLGTVSSSLKAQGFSLFSKPKVVEPCNVYWNGREFKKGVTKGDSSFTRLGYSFWGVESVVVALPIGMAKEFGIENVEVGKEIVSSKKFETFMTNQWDDINKLCKLEKLK